jgi:lipoate-protein ligase A
VRSKYSTWEWNFGYSPNYNFRKVIRTEKSGTIEFDLDVHNGTIMNIKIFGDYFSRFDTEEIETALTGIVHNENAIRQALEPFSIGDYFDNLTPAEFMTGMF